jgi:hypothetical protein
MDPRSVLNSKRKIDQSVRDVLMCLVNEVERLESVNQFLLAEVHKLRETRGPQEAMIERIPDSQESQGSVNSPDEISEIVNQIVQEVVEESEAPQEVVEESPVPQESEVIPQEPPKKTSRFGRRV